MIATYSGDRCDLCGSTESTALIARDDGFGMWSDARLSNRPLQKNVCVRCGLIREGNPFTSSAYEEHYARGYRLNATEAVEEHMFFRNGARVPRSAAIAAVIGEAMASSERGGVASVYEVGAGQGTLMRRLTELFPRAAIAGCEMNEHAAARARADGWQVVTGDASVLTGLHDLIIAVGVLEHVPSPVAFLRRLADHLRADGRIVTFQPMQDVESYDVFFVDHLHHFHLRHVEWAANRSGLVQERLIRSPWFAPNFSLHVLRRGPAVEPRLSYVAPDTPRAAVCRWQEIFQRGHDLALRSTSKTFALYGLSEVAGLLYCYGGLNRLRLAFGLDDFPERHHANPFGLPVRTIDDLGPDERKQIDGGIVLSLNPAYHAQVAARCRRAGMDTISLFE